MVPGSSPGGGVERTVFQFFQIENTRQTLEVQILARSPHPLPGVFLRTGKIRSGVFFVDVAELVYALGLGSSGAIHEGSSPFIDTCQSNLNSL